MFQFNFSNDQLFQDLPEFAGSLNCFGPLFLPIAPVERTKQRGTADDDYMIGTSGHDEMVGLGGDDIFLGSAGYDLLRGGAGIDMVDYSGSHCGVSVDLQNNTGWGGDAHGDTYGSIEDLFGSDRNDTLKGSRFDNTLNGGEGDDLIDGERGNDDLRGGNGTFDDTLEGGAGDDTLYGGRGENSLQGDAGADTFRLFFVDTVTTIEDFTQGEDVFDISSSFSYAGFMSRAVQDGNDVVFTRENTYLNYTTTFVLKDLQLGDLSESDFLTA